VQKWKIGSKNACCRRALAVSFKTGIPLPHCVAQQNVTVMAASTVEPLGFSGSLPIVSLCYILCNTILANKHVLFFLVGEHRDFKFGVRVDHNKSQP